MSSASGEVYRLSLKRHFSSFVQYQNMVHFRAFKEFSRLHLPLFRACMQGIPRFEFCNTLTLRIVEAGTLPQRTAVAAHAQMQATHSAKVAAAKAAGLPLPPMPPILEATQYLSGDAPTTLRLTSGKSLPSTLRCAESVAYIMYLCGGEELCVYYLTEYFPVLWTNESFLRNCCSESVIGVAVCAVQLLIYAKLMKKERVKEVDLTFFWSTVMSPISKASAIDRAEPSLAPFKPLDALHSCILLSMVGNLPRPCALLDDHDFRWKEVVTLLRKVRLDAIASSLHSMSDREQRRMWLRETFQRPDESLSVGPTSSPSSSSSSPSSQPSKGRKNSRGTSTSSRPPYLTMNELSQLLSREMHKP